VSTGTQERPDLAFRIGATYAGRSLGDEKATEDEWRDIGRAGLAAVSLPERHGGGGDVADLCLVWSGWLRAGLPRSNDSSNGR